MGDLARAVGIGVGTVSRIISGGTDRVDVATVEAVFALPWAPPSPGAVIDAHDAQAALAALRNAGWSLEVLAEQLAVPWQTLQRLPSQERCTRRVADCITVFHDEFFAVDDDADDAVEDCADPLEQLVWFVTDTEQSWRADAACRQLPGDDRTRSNVFFPSRGDNAGVDRARAVCARCSVCIECLDFAMTMHNDTFEIGVYGATSGAERRALRHQERTESHHVDASDDDADDRNLVPVSEQVA
jgi:WhiB family redox-sensing transcriptional regulator